MKNDLGQAIKSWEPMDLVRRPQFGKDELRILDRAARSFKPEKRTIVFLSLENPFASLGGLGTITRYYPKALQDAGENVVFITPFHGRNKAVIDAVARKTLVCTIKAMTVIAGAFRAKASCYRDAGAPVPSYYLSIDRFFMAPRHPYDYPAEHDLLCDALAFCGAVPAVCAKLGVGRNVVFHANDWETAPVAITAVLSVIDGTLHSARTVLTLHNSFDCGLPRAMMQRFFGRTFAGETVLQSCIPLLDAPLAAVSAPFAAELQSDPLQKLHFVPHLQLLLRNTAVVGIDNGLFGRGRPVMPRSVLTKAKRGDAGAVISFKAERHAEALRAVAAKRDTRIIGRFTAPPGRERVPLLFMMGRLDIMQKGFDVVFNAFRRLPPGTAKLFFCPTLAPGQPAGALEFFARIARRCRGDIIIWPFRLGQEEYELLLQGAAYMLMPSLYEPFGAATEAYCNATPVVARATGGLIVQVEPLNSVKRPGRATGILFRESPPLNSIENDWRRLLELPLERRMSSQLYGAIVAAAQSALETAVRAFGDERCYATLIANGMAHLKKFGWDKTARKYRHLYDKAVALHAGW